ncbi:hypothetical protein PCA31118_02439 [Pandoraea captiosa]|uniref:Uncharacterized protein n=1 Tax=Pandoraea captiosa TaxID=2508302 RepID=A0A5E5A019_9BURK|nr:hypothetical protein [Pandoraea captiosa]VVE67001.1 hypothetical protein PCA31118_02439 [Pandoraea captiosa]
MDRQGRINRKVSELISEFEARLRALGFYTEHHPASESEDGLGFLVYQAARNESGVCTSCEDTGTITEWYPAERLPTRDGVYQIKDKARTVFAEFREDKWSGVEPIAWRGVDWRVSDDELARLLNILRDQEHGSKPDAALALIRHRLTCRNNDQTADEYDVEARVYARVILKKNPSGAKEVLHLVEEDITVPVSENVRKRIEHCAEMFGIPED